MSERKYSVAEIDRMRNAIRWSYPSRESYFAEERSREIEDRLRTYMLNGTEPEELERMAEERIKADHEAEERWREMQVKLAAEQVK